MSRPPERPTAALTSSIVICAYTEKRWDELALAVASARRQTRPAVQIVLAVDHNPGLAARAREALPDVIVVESSERPGLSGARNAGVAAATGDIVAFLDDDAEAAPDWLECLLGPYADAGVLGVGGHIEPRWAQGRPRAFPPEFGWVVGCSYEGLPRVAAPVRNLIGANMSLRRSVFARVGGFRAEVGRVGELPAGCEETELCIRVRRDLGSGIFVHEPGARVDHAVPATRSTWRYFRSRCFAEGVSKARVTQLVGRRDGLSSERSYVLRTLSAGLRRELRNAVRGDPAAVQRGAAIVAGLALTASGYVAGSLTSRLH